MPYGLKDEDFDKIQNKIAKKLYEIPSLDRAAFLMGCTEQELREAMTELRKTPKSLGKNFVFLFLFPLFLSSLSMASIFPLDLGVLRGSGRKRAEE